MVFSILEYVLKFSLQSVLKFVLLEKKLNHGLPGFASSPPLGGGPDENSRKP